MLYTNADNVNMKISELKKIKQFLLFLKDFLFRPL